MKPDCSSCRYFLVNGNVAKCYLMDIVASGIIKGGVVLQMPLDGKCDGYEKRVGVGVWSA